MEVTSPQNYISGGRIADEKYFRFFFEPLLGSLDVSGSGFNPARVGREPFPGCRDCLRQHLCGGAAWSFSHIDEMPGIERTMKNLPVEL